MLKGGVLKRLHAGHRMVTECCQCANVANTTVASCQFCHHLAIGIGNWQHFHIGNISAGRPCMCRRGRRARAPPRRPFSFVFRSSCASWFTALHSTATAWTGQMRGGGKVRPKSVRATERKGRKENGGCGIARRLWRLCHQPPFSVHCFGQAKMRGPIVS